ncbi:MAG TPA: T9SS type A sorting domain-containing protein [Cyclobacteriaceae bacterium]
MKNPGQPPGMWLYVLLKTNPNHLLRLSAFIVAYLFLLSKSYAQIQLDSFDDAELVIEGERLRNPWTGGLNAAQVSTMDIDFDDDDDLIVFDRASNTVSVFIADQGRYDYSEDHAFLFPDDITNWFLLRDYNFDGKKDIFTFTGLGIRVFKNISDEGEIQWELVADPILTKGFGQITNLFLNATDIPAIADLKNDGDLDILVFNFATGITIRKYENLSQDNFGNADSLDFELTDNFWGELLECDCGQFAFGDEGSCGTDDNRILHVSGKSMMLMDMDNDGDLDFFLGHEDCIDLNIFENVGSPESALFESYNPDLIPVFNTIDFIEFPGAFNEDVTFDGQKDIIVSPNIGFNATGTFDFSNSIWLFESNGQDYELISSDFLQKEMLDVGETSYPALHDYDSDGDLDLFVGNEGSSTQPASLQLFENQGNIFELVDDDFLNLSSYAFNQLQSQFIDLDNDPEQELVIKALNLNNDDGEIFLIDNSGQGFSDILTPFNFSYNKFENPHLVDVDEDGTVDVLLGKTVGNIEFYNNTGTNENPSFERTERFFLGIEQNGILGNMQMTNGFIDDDNQMDLITTDRSGRVSLYSDFRNSGDSTIIKRYNQLKDQMEVTRYGQRSPVVVGQLFGDERKFLVFGTAQGGVRIAQISASGKGNPSPPVEQVLFSIYPNPVNADRLIKIQTNQPFEARIVSIDGRIVYKKLNIESGISIDLSNLKAGFYLLDPLNKPGEPVKFILR